MAVTASSFDTSTQVITKIVRERTWPSGIHLGSYLAASGLIFARASGGLGLSSRYRDRLFNCLASFTIVFTAVCLNISVFKSTCEKQREKICLDRQARRRSLSAVQCGCHIAASIHF